MQSSHESDFSNTMLELWDLVKPSDAKDLKVIVGSPDGRFAGIYTCEIDQHGDRFFVLKEKPRSQTWTLASNLLSHFDDLASVKLGKSARLMINEFREIFCNPLVKYEPMPDGYNLCQDSSVDEGDPAGVPERSQEIPRPHSSCAAGTFDARPAIRLSGQELLDRAKSLERCRPDEMARLCGYLIEENGDQAGDVESFYAALHEAYSG
jgi:hypothetical protein